MNEKKQIEKLKEQIAQLEQRVKALETRSSHVPIYTPVYTTDGTIVKMTLTLPRG